jgi:prephenate dehydrogenase
MQQKLATVYDELHRLFSNKSDFITDMLIERKKEIIKELEHNITELKKCNINEIAI